MENNNSIIASFQFTHPGQEHSAGYSLPDTNFYFKNWNYNNGHRRKYLRLSADYIDIKGNLINGYVDTWGEWEPNSLSKSLPEQSSHEFPRFIHYPIYIKESQNEPKTKIEKKVAMIKKNECKNKKDLQNTDPFIYGDNFFYTCCKQSQTKNLLPGSVIVFGSTFKKPDKFVMDTVFVISEIIDCDKEAIEKYKGTMLYDVVLHKIYYGHGSEHAKSNKIIIGASCSKPYDGMYSFFPCHPSSDKHSYTRLSIDKTINSNISSVLQSRGIYITKGSAETKEFWQQLCNHTLSNGYSLGVRAYCPPEIQISNIEKYLTKLS